MRAVFRVRQTPSLSLLGGGACFIDYDGDGRHDLVLPGGVRGMSLYRNTGSGNFSDVTQGSGLVVSGEALGCAAGDYDNDNQTDLVVGFQGRNMLFIEIRVAAHSRMSQLKPAFVSTGFLWESFFSTMTMTAIWTFTFQGSRTFHSDPEVISVFLSVRRRQVEIFCGATMATGRLRTGPRHQVLQEMRLELLRSPADFNNDRAIDLILTGWRSSPAVLTNAREGPFRSVDVWRSPFPAAAAGAVALDFDKDGWMDLAFTHWSQPGFSVWRNLSGNGFERVSVPQPQWTRGWGLAAVDVDNDGWLDLAAAGEGSGRGELLLIRNLGGGRFSDMTATAGLASLQLVRPRALVAADTDGDGDSDLLVTQNGGPPVLLRNDGGNRRRSLRLVLQGLNDNRSGIGTKVEVFAGALRQKWEVPSASGYLGQSAPEILAGIGEAREADVVRLLWPTGVPQDEVQLGAGQRHVVKEIDRRGSSCPVVFVWDGKRYQFISDIIGPGIIGEWIGPGERNVPDPTEYLKVDGRLVEPKNGRLSFRFAEVMEEITYLDHVRLLAIDHPSDVVVNPNEYFASQPPFPEFKVVTSRNLRPPRAAIDDTGRNVLPLLLNRDRRYVTSFDSLPYRGYAKMHYLELDLGAIDSSAPLRLIMHGFIDYFTVTSIFAAYQGQVQPIVPFLEIPAGNGQWKRVSDDIGFPAGLARTMVSDLSGRLPAGTSRVRIGTNLKIYWDQILIDTTPQNEPFDVHEVPLAEAVFGFRGYPRKVEGTVAGDVSYVYEDVSSSGPYARASGQYTAYGNVRSLITQRDDHFVIIGSGDEVALEFDPGKLPNIKTGWVRDYFLYADGFAKDMDFYSAYSATVEPLPFHAMGQYPYGPETTFPSDAAHLAYRLRSNTRSESGSSGTSYRFRYPSGQSGGR